VIKLKSIKLKNYCGYRNFELDLTEGDGVKRWAMFFGPNGVGKSNFIRAVDLLSRPKAFMLKKNTLTFRKLKYHHDYVAGAEPMYEHVNDLEMEGVFLVDGVEKRVVLQDNVKGVIFAGRQVDEENGEISGVKVNDLGPEEQGVIFVDADSRNMMTKFQIIDDIQKPFCDFAKAVYGYDCYCPSDAVTYDQGIKFITDFVLEKPDGTRVHYKRFSDGEKKIATLISSLFKRAYRHSPNKEDKDILIIDNIEMHIYFKRHMALIEKMEEYFPDKQIIATTHSPVIIENLDKKYLVDLEERLAGKEQCQPLS
jgi:predicted ATPase